MSERVELFTPGCLGTCWYGKYHYMEPWIGCEHDCDYCYARHRSVVHNTLSHLRTTFAHPVPLEDPDTLIASVRNRLKVGDVRILKLSRFTDLFIPKCLASGLTAALLEVLAESPVERVIITTKGVPDETCISLMSRHPSRFSYSLVAKPQSSVCLERNAPPVSERLAVGARLAASGILTTVHMDPVVPGFEDEPGPLDSFLDLLESHRLNRVMFSFLLLCDSMVDELKLRLGKESVDRIIESFDRGKSRQYLPGQKETRMFAPSVETMSGSVERIAAKLRSRGFSFVLCSLKNVGSGIGMSRAECPRCDGTFYA